MKCFTIDPHADEVDNQIKITSGILLTDVTINRRNAVGVSLGYFNPRESDEEGNPLRPRCLKVLGAKSGDTVTEMYIETLGEEHKHKTGLIKVREPRDDSDHVLVYLDVSNPKGRARWQNAKGLSLAGNLLEGRYYSNNVVQRPPKEPGKFLDFCCPSLLTMTAGEKYTLRYWNSTTHSLRDATFCYADGKISIVNNVPVQKKTTVTKSFKKRKQVSGGNHDAKFTRPKSDFGAKLADAFSGKNRTRRDGKDHRYQREW